MKNNKMHKLPSVSEILNKVRLQKIHNESFIKFKIKEEIGRYRKLAKKDQLFLSRDEITHEIIEKLLNFSMPSIKSVINGTGIVLHTGLGRAPLSSKTVSNISKKMSGYVNLEYDLETGKRGHRQKHISELISSVVGSQDAIAVNNNAAAVLLSLNELAEHKEVIISRGQLVEIGGSFRIPDMIAKSGCKMVEVGTTNRTHLKDYENAINPNTGLILWVHTSNYTITGFTKDVDISELVGLGKKNRIPVMADLGCGEILDLSHKGIPTNIIVNDVVSVGTSITTFSGDKLLGGPQSGLIVGNKALIKRIRNNPIARTVRCDKWTISILEETLRTMQNGGLNDNLAISLLMSSRKSLRKRAEKIVNQIPKKILKKHKLNIVETEVESGSGTLPNKSLESIAISFESTLLSPSQLSNLFRSKNIPVVGYIKKNKFYIDFKSIIPKQEKILLNAIVEVLGL